MPMKMYQLSVMTVMDLTAPELEFIFEMIDRGSTGRVEIRTLSSELFAIKNHDDSMALAMIKFNSQETHRCVKSAIPKIEELTKQGENLSAQINLFDKKIERLVGAAINQHVQVDPPTALLHEIGVDPSAQEPFNDTGSPLLMHHSRSNVAISQAANTQQEVQNLLDVSRMKASMQVDISSARLATSVTTLMSAEGVKDTLDIKTIEVWLVVHKYEQCRANLQRERADLMEQQHNKLHNMPVQTEDRQDLASPRRQGISQLKDLVVQLLQLDMHDVPKRAIFALQLHLYQ